MRRLLMVVLLLCSGAVAAQTDDRRVRTVRTDQGPERAGQSDERRVGTGPTDEGAERAGQSDERRRRTVRTDQALPRAAQPDDEDPERAGQSDERRGPTVRTDQGSELAVQSDEHREGEEHPDEHLILARQLVGVGPESGDHSEFGATCDPEPETMRAEIAAAYRASPGQFHGISPQSAYWPEVEQVWRARSVDRCAAQSDESPAAIIARRYAANLSTTELREVVAFQESPSGRAFIAATRLARQDLESPPAARPRRDTDAASTTFRQAMLRLKEKYERAPK